MMKKLILTLLILSGLALPATVHAQFDPLGEACDNTTTDASVCNADGTNNPIAGRNGILLRIVNILSYVVGVASVIMIIFGGLKFITASGDSTNIATARNTILYALIGVVVFLFSQIIVRFVLNKL
jgi:hypothetical protein